MISPNPVIDNSHRSKILEMIVTGPVFKDEQIVRENIDNADPITLLILSENPVLFK